jgi:murein DD-endopeptidase MepM/ murein hydrolase activator NlpD
MWSDFMKRMTAFFKEELSVSAAEAEEETTFVAPLSRDRITKKPFGIHVDPKNSPVTPEKFTGYHTGIDFEAKEGETDVPVVAACTGPIIAKRTVGGYGGVLIQTCVYKGETVTVLYGHLRLSSIAKKIGDSLSAGEQFALLGTGFSDETDGERPHLHLGVHKGDVIEYKGYVESESALQQWIGDVF